MMVAEATTGKVSDNTGRDGGGKGTRRGSEPVAAAMALGEVPG